MNTRAACLGIFVLGLWTVCIIRATEKSENQDEIRKVPIENMTNTTKNRVATIEFKVGKRTNLTKAEYKAIRRAILDALNRRNSTPFSTPTTEEILPQTSTGLTDISTTTEAATTISTTATDSTTTVTQTIPTTATERIPNRRRRRSSNQYTDDDLDFVLIDPEELDGVFRVTLFGTGDGEPKITQEMLLDAIKEVEQNGELSKAADNLEVNKYYGNLPPFSSEPTTLPTVVWYTWLGILIGILLFVLILLLLICLLCRRRRLRNRLPITDSDDEDEIVDRTEPEKLQHQTQPRIHAAPPSPCSNGVPPRTPLIEDKDGWIVPLSQLSDDEAPVFLPVRF